MRGGKPDCVPVAPDISNMIPCRLTGKPFWDIYLYDNPPRWKAYIRAVRHFGFDGWLDGVPIRFDFERDQAAKQPTWQEAIVARTAERIYTRQHAVVDGRRKWSGHCTVYYIDNPPTHEVPLSKVGLPTDPPDEWQDVPRDSRLPGLEAYHAAREMMGDDGVIGLHVGLPGLQLGSDMIYEYFDDRARVLAWCHTEHRRLVCRTEEIVKLEPDFVLVGVSGFMLTNPEPIFRELALPALKDITAICKRADVISQIHCCGPERSLVRIAAEETDLDSINPLEPPPMGDCDLAEIKKQFGHKLSLMGNLHTTDVMLRGTPDDVARASRQAIDDAGEGGGFILSTGDQCGRDTPDANIHAMIEVARTYGRY